jgi:hypothetical protein
MLSGSAVVHYFSGTVLILITFVSRDVGNEEPFLIICVTSEDAASNLFAASRVALVNTSLRV